MNTTLPSNVLCYSKVVAFLCLLIFLGWSPLSYGAAALSLSWNPATSEYTPGCSDGVAGCDVIYELTIDNTGGVSPADDAINVVLNLGSDGSSGSTSGVAFDWSCALGSGSSGSNCGATTSGSNVGTLSQSGLKIAAGESLVFTVKGRFDASLTSSVIDLDASVSPTHGSTLSSLPLSRQAETDFALVLAPNVANQKYVPGNTVTGISAPRLVITNNGPSDANEATISWPMPSAVASVDWSCSDQGSNPVTNTYCTGSSQSGVGVLGGVTISTKVTVPAGDSVVIQLDNLKYKADASAASVSYAPTITLGSGDTDGNLGNNTSSISYQREAQTDFVLALTPNVANQKYVPGNTVTGVSAPRLVIANNGPSDANEATISWPMPSAVASVDWSCSDQGSNPVTNTYCTGSSQSGVGVLGGVTISTKVTVPAGDSVVIQLDNLKYKADASAASVSYAPTVALDSGDVDDNASNNIASISYDRQIRTSYQVALTPNHPNSNKGSYTPGGTASGTVFSVGVKNDGPSDGSGVDLEVSLNGKLVGGQWACQSCTTTSGTIAANTASLSFQLNNLDAGAAAKTVVFSDLVYTSSASDQWVVSATATRIDTDEVAEVGEQSFANNIYDPNRQVDLHLTKRINGTDQAANLPRGNAFYYDIVVTNDGPSDVGQVLDESVQITDIINSSLKGDPGKCPAGGANPCWEYCPNGTLTSCSTELSADSGFVMNISDLVLESGTSKTIRLYVSSSDSVPNGTAITNTAEVEVVSASGVSFPVTETDITNNSDTATVTVEVNSDFSVLIDDTQTSAVPGASHAYTVKVENEGFSNGNGVAVNASLPIFDASITPAGFVSGGIEWQCQAYGGACCNSNSNSCGANQAVSLGFMDALNGQKVDLPVGSYVEFTVVGSIDSRATGTLNAAANIVIPSGLSDVNAGNNSAADTDTQLTSVVGLTLKKRLVRLNEVAGNKFHLVYELSVGNDGPSFANGVTLKDALSDSLLDASTGKWCDVSSQPSLSSCDSVPSSNAAASGVTINNIDLAAGDGKRYLVEVDTEVAPIGQITNTATASLGVSQVSDTVKASIGGEADLQITNTDNETERVAGTNTEYVVQVKNNGPSDAFGVNISNTFPDKLEDITWTCEAVTPVPGDLSTKGVAGAGNTMGGALVHSSDGRHVYQLTKSGGDFALVAYARNDVAGLGFGALSAIDSERQGINDPSDTGVAVDGMSKPIDVALSTNGAWLYVLSVDDSKSPVESNIVLFNRTNNAANPDHGKLSYAATVTLSDANPKQIELINKHLYLSSDAGIRMFSLDQYSGLPTADQEVSPLSGVKSFVFSPDQAFAFVSKSSAPQLAMLRVGGGGGVDPAGRLIQEAGLTDAKYEADLGIQVSPDGKHVYVSSAGGLHVVSYDAPSVGTVSLTPISSYLTTADLGSNNSVAFAANQMAIAPDGEHVLLTLESRNELWQLRRDKVSGVLSWETTFNRGISTTATPDELTFSADGRHVLISLSSADTSAISVLNRRAPDPRFDLLEVDKEGQVTGSSSSALVSGLNAPADMAISPDGKHLYAISLGGDKSLTVFSRNETLGLTAETTGQHLQYKAKYVDGVNGVQGLKEPRYVLISPDGQYVFVTDTQNNSLSVFARDDQTGLLTHQVTFGDEQGGVSALLGAAGMAMDSASSTLYVAAEYEQAIAIFKKNGSTFQFAGEVRAGNGVTGLERIRDLHVTSDGLFVIGVSRGNNGQGKAVVLKRGVNPADPAAFGQLSFAQSLLLGVQQPTAITLTDDDKHVYITAEGSNQVVMLSRITDPNASDYGHLLVRQVYTDGVDGIRLMRGPKDIKVSRDGKQAYVVAASSNSVLVFDRDANTSSQSYGHLTLVEVRQDDLEGVDGIANPYALAVSPISSFVYVGGFRDSAIATFILGNGSRCSASGAGVINDDVNIARNGTLEYRVKARIRPDATGMIDSTASLGLPDRFVDSNTNNNAATDQTSIRAQGDLSITKTNAQVSVIAGQETSYDIVISNAGPSNLGDQVGAPVLVRDVLSSNFIESSARWTCRADNSGAIKFIDSHLDGEVGLEKLAGANDAAWLKQPNGSSYLVVSGVLDESLTVFSVGASGELSPLMVLAQGDQINKVSGGSVTIAGLGGASSVATSADGQYIYVTSRTNDSVSVFAADHSGGSLSLSLVETYKSFDMDQAQHVLLSNDADQKFVYVAAANARSIVVFERDAISGTLTQVEMLVHGQNDLQGNLVLGLLSVGHLIQSPDGLQLYATSSSQGTIARFDRNATTGRLTFRSVQKGSDFGSVNTDGLSQGQFDASGKYLYLTASRANRVLILERDLTTGSTQGKLSYSGELQEDVDGNKGLLSPQNIVLSGDNKHAYVSGQANGSVAWFLRDEVDGSLSYLGMRAESETGVSGLLGARDVLLSEATNDLYVVGSTPGSVAHFKRSIDAYCPPNGTGSIRDVSIRIPVGGSVAFRLDVQISPDLSGTLSNVASVSSAADSSTGNNSSEDADPYNKEVDLSITKDDGLAEFDGLAGALSMAGDEKNIYVAGAEDNAIGVFKLESNQTKPDFGKASYHSVLRDGDQNALGLSGVSDVLLSKQGTHVYALSPVQNSIAAFKRLADGGLTFMEVQQNGVAGVAGMSGAQAMARSHDDAHIYVASTFANSVAVFQRNIDAASPDHGKLTWEHALQNNVDGVVSMGKPAAVAVSADDKHVYVLGQEEDGIAVFLRNPNAGSGTYGKLTYKTSYKNGSAGINDMLGVASLAFSGNNLYVLAAESGSVHHFVRSADGSLAAGGSWSDDDNGVNKLIGAKKLRVSADGQKLFVTTGAKAAIMRFDVQPDGSLVFAGQIKQGDSAPLTGGKVVGLIGAQDVFHSTVSGQLYSVSRTDAALSTFEQDPADSFGFQYTNSLFDGLGGVAPGEVVTYDIVVSNAGPSDTLAQVVDDFPSEFSQISWVCTASGTAQCPSSGVGNLNARVSLPKNTSILFRASGRVGASTTGRLSNTATVSAIGAADVNMNNNTATDDNTVLSPAIDLGVTVDNGQTEVVPGKPVNYILDVLNQGPSYGKDVNISDVLPASLYDVRWSCQASPTAGSLSGVSPVAFDAGFISHQSSVVTQSGRYMYVLGTEISGTALVRFDRDPLTGVLSNPVHYRNAGATTGLSGGVDLLLSRDERFVYVAGATDDTIVVFARDANDGTLAFVARYADGFSGIDGVGGLSALAQSLDGRYLYASGAIDQAIATFAINSSTGELTQINQINQADGNNGLNGISDMIVSPDGSKLYAVAAQNQSLLALSINSSTGLLSALTMVEDFELPTDKQGALSNPVHVSMANDRVVVVSKTSGKVTGFELIEGNTSSWKADWQITGLSDPQSTTFDADQDRLYVTDTNRLSLYGLQREVPELLETQEQTAHPHLSGSGLLMLGPDKQQLYWFAPASEHMLAWARLKGSRCPLNGEGSLDGLNVDIAVGGRVSIEVSGMVYANASGNISYNVTATPQTEGQELNSSDNMGADTDRLVPNADLSISKTVDKSTVVAGEEIQWKLALANAGVSDAIKANLVDLMPVYPTAPSGVKAQSTKWQCEVNKPLTQVGQVNTGASPELESVSAAVLSVNGQYLYAVSPKSSAILIFPRTVSDGALGTPVLVKQGDVIDGVTVDGLAQASHLAMSADGKNLLVVGKGSDTLMNFEVNQIDGSLTVKQHLKSGVGRVIGLIGVSHVASSSDGAWVFTASAQSSSIAMFRRNKINGELTFVERIKDGLGTFGQASNVIQGIQALQLSDDDQYLYAVSADSGSVSWYQIDSANNQLVYRGMHRQGEAGLDGMTGAKALTISPGDKSLYVLGDRAINQFEPKADGSLVWVSRHDDILGAEEVSDMVLDASGSRLYLSLADGAIHVFARDWNNGKLHMRHDLSTLGTGVNTLFQLSDTALYAMSPAGQIDWLGEKALSQCFDAGSANDQIQTSVDLGVTGSAVIIADAVIDPSARGSITNAAGINVATGGNDPNLTDNQASAVSTIQVVSDLSLSKTGPVEAIAGEQIEYRIVLNNAGPSSALGARVVDDLSTSLLNASWTCEATAGSECPGVGTGNLDVPVNVLPDGSVSFVVTATIASDVLGALDNQAKVVPEVGSSDPTPLDQLANSPTTTVRAEVDIKTSKDNGVTDLVAGKRTNYQIKVENLGPSDARRVQVNDLLPEQLSDAVWTCSGSSTNVSCPAVSGVDTLDVELAIPAGEHVVFDLGVLLDSTATGSVENIAQATLVDETVERDASNNIAKDQDAIVIEHDLSIQVTPIVTKADPEGLDPLVVDVRYGNVGPSAAHDVVVDVVFSTPVSIELPANCVLAKPTQLSCTQQRLLPGAFGFLSLTLADLPAAPAILDVTASVKASGTETDISNNSQAASVELVSAGDVQVFVKNAQSMMRPGETYEYEIVVQNQGSVRIEGIVLEALLQPEFVDVRWSCSASVGVTCQSGTGTPFTDTLSLSQGDKVTYQLSVTIDPALTDAQLPIQAMLKATAKVPDGVDINLVNNSSISQGLITNVLFSDGFESPNFALSKALKQLDAANDCGALHVPHACVVRGGQP